MEDMIEKIIQMDKKARESLTEANQLKIDAERKISDIKEQRRNEYIDRARTNIKVLEKEEKIKAAVKLKIIENTYEQKYSRIEKVYYDNKDKWIKAIVDRVIQK